MTSSTPLVFITGATGDVGSQTVKLLNNTAVHVRVLCRREEQAQAFAKDGIEAVIGDLNDPVAKLVKHMDGCDTLLLLTAANPQQLGQNLNAIDAAVLAGVKWIIRLSAADAREDGNVPWVKAHYAADQYLSSRARSRGITWTILSASAFMQNILSEAPAIRKGFLPQSCGDGKAGWIDTSDIANVACQLLLDGPDKHGNRTYILTGPKLISLPEMAEELTAQFGHRVRHVDLPGPVFGMILRLSGADAWTADGLVAQFNEIVRPNKEGIDVSGDVEAITGRPPTSFEQFVVRHRSQLEGSDYLPRLQLAAAGILLPATVALAMKLYRKSSVR